MLYMATGKPAQLGCKFFVRCVSSKFSRKHETEQQDSDYQQLHNDRTIYYWLIWQKIYNLIEPAYL